MKACYGLMFAMLLAGCATQGGQSSAGKEQDPRATARINTQLGTEYLRKGDFELARDKLEKAVDLDPKNAEAQGLLGLLYANTGELRKAEKHYENSLELRPDDPNVRNNYGVMLCSQGKYEKADLQFRRAMQSTRYSTPEVALTNAGVCARKLPDETRAEAYFREALKQNPDFVDALAQMVQLSADQASYLNARGFLQRYQSLKAPMTKQLLLLGIRVELALGDRVAAQRYAQTLRSDFPDDRFGDRTEEFSPSAGTSIINP